MRLENGKKNGAQNNLIYTISDTHWWHSNILKLMPQTRKFSSIEEMNQTLIDNWNSAVSKEDTVYFLGDLAFCGTQKIETILKQLNYKKLIMIKGNHDRQTSNKRWLELGMSEVHEQLEIEYKEHKFLLCHFPYLTGSETEDTRYLNLRPEDKELNLIHGHIHSVPERKIRVTPKNTKMYDVGVDANNMYPVSLDRIVEELGL